jgi:hypothetical protein
MNQFNAILTISILLIANLLIADDSATNVPEKTGRQIVSEEHVHSAEAGAHESSLTIPGSKSSEKSQHDTENLKLAAEVKRLGQLVIDLESRGLAWLAAEAKQELNRLQAPEVKKIAKYTKRDNSCDTGVEK